MLLHKFIPFVFVGTSYNSEIRYSCSRLIDSVSWASDYLYHLPLESVQISCIFKCPELVTVFQLTQILPGLNRRGGCYADGTSIYLVSPSCVCVCVCA